MPPTAKDSSGRRLRSKFKTHVEAGNFYEAHQLCNTLLFRYSNSENYPDAFELITYSANIFIDHAVFHSTFDLLNQYVNLASKASEFGNHERMIEFKSILGRLSEQADDRISVINLAVKKSKTQKLPRGNPVLHLYLAKMYEEEFQLQKARYHYIFSSDPKKCALFCIKLSHAGLQTEVSLFAAQAILQYLVIEEVEYAKTFLDFYVQCHPKIQTKNIPFDFPLLNCCYFLLVHIPNGKLDNYLRLTSAYEKSLKRDQSFAPCLEKIGVKYFGLSVPKPSGGGGLMGLLDSLFETMGDGDADKAGDEDEFLSADENADDSTDLNRDSKRIKISEPKIEASDLD
ncbi:Golgi to ER traffic protein 4 homolog [Convolutriloba macropyga]|uniref:Golgi to ER traffic protein 4 homolog n=1 Tax=Convolutriloba macropyga TaxID=536237 RepID=UPI003F51CF68